MSCASTAPNDTPPADELVIGVPEGNVANPDLGVNQLANQIVLEALTQHGPAGRAAPRLARSWAWENDEHRLRLQLRDDVMLHDGTRLDSQLAAERLAIAISRGANRAGYPSLTAVTAAVPAGPHELVLHLSTRASLLPEDLTVLLDLPAGPYRQVEANGEEIELERFEQHYGGTPPIARVTLRPLDTLRNGWASLLRGRLDMVYDVPADAIEFIRNDDVQVVSVPRWYQYVIAFNSARPPLGSPLVRRALNIAVDRQALIARVLNGRGTPAYGPIWPSYWAYDSLLTPYAFDPAMASSLLDQAGMRMPTVTRASTSGPPARFSITCLIPENFIVWEHIALEVQRDLFNVGVDLQFEVLPFREFNERIAAGQFDAVLLDLVSGPTPARPYLFWRSAQNFKGQFNTFGYENADAERMFDVLRTSTNEAAVRSATQRLQRIMADDPPALFLAWSERARAIRRDIVVPPHNAHDFMWTIGNWSRNPSLASAR